MGNPCPPSVRTTMDTGMKVIVYLTPVHDLSEGGEEHFSRAITLSPVKSSVIVGRASKTISKGLFPARENAWFDSPIMSREHAKLSTTIDGTDIRVILQDLDSTHGTWLVKRRLVGSDGHALLHNGDVITFGSTVTSGPDTFLGCQFEVEISIPSSDEPAVAGSSSSPVSERSGFHVPDTEMDSYSSDASDAGSCHIVDSHPRTFSVPSSCDEMDASDDDDVVISASRRSRLTTRHIDVSQKERESFEVDDVDSQPDGQGHGAENDSQLGSAVDPIEVDEGSAELQDTSDEEDDPETDYEIQDIDDEDKQQKVGNDKATAAVDSSQGSKGPDIPNSVASQSKLAKAQEAMIEQECFSFAYEGSCRQAPTSQADPEPAQQQSHEHDEGLGERNVDLIPDTYEDQPVASTKHGNSHLGGGNVNNGAIATEDDFSVRYARAPSSDFEFEDTPDFISESRTQTRRPAHPWPDSVIDILKQNQPLSRAAPTLGDSQGSRLAAYGAQSSNPYTSDGIGKEGLQLRPWRELPDEWQEPSVKAAKPSPRWNPGTCVSRSQLDDPSLGCARAPSPSDAALARKADVGIPEIPGFRDKLGPFKPLFNPFIDDPLVPLPDGASRPQNTPYFPAIEDTSPPFQIYQDTVGHRHGKPAGKEDAMTLLHRDSNPYVQGPFSVSYQSFSSDEPPSPPKPLSPSPSQKKKCLVKLKYDKAGEVVQEKVDNSKASKVDISNLVNPHSEASRGTKRKIDESELEYSSPFGLLRQAAPSSPQILGGGKSKSDHFKKTDSSNSELSRERLLTRGGIVASHTKAASETDVAPKAREPPRKKAKTSPSSTAGTIGKVVSGVCLGVVGAFAALVAATPTDVWEEALRETARLK